MPSPFDDIRALFDQFPAKPAAPASPTAFGELAPAADWIVRWRGEARVTRPILCLYAASHAGGDTGPVRARMEAIAAGEAAINRAAHHLGAGLDVFDLAVERPVADTAVGAAMSERDCAATMAFGMEALAKQPDLLMLAGMGPGADQAAGDLALALDDLTQARASIGAVARARTESLGEPLQLLRQLGGRETAAVAGAILAARIQGVPVLLDGAPALAAAAILRAVDPEAVAHCRIAGAPHTAAGRILTGRLDQGRLFGLHVGLEDGTAALATLSVVKLALAIAAGA